MATTKERIKASQEALKTAKSLYADGKKQYDSALEAYNVAKASVIQAETLIKTLKDTNLDSKQILQKASQYVSDPANYGKDITQLGVSPDQIIKQQLNKATGVLNSAQIIRRKAEKEFQKATKFLNGLKDRINVIANQLQIAISKISLKKQADTQKQIVNTQIKVVNKKVKLNGGLLNKRVVASTIKAVQKAAAVYATSKLLNLQLNKLSKDTQRLGELVDKTNEIISNVKTKQDVQKAKATRDAALSTLASAERKITQIRNIIKTLQTLLFIIKLVLFLLTLIPLKTRPAKVKKIVKAMMTIDAATVLLGAARAVLDSLIAEIQYQRARLLPISDIIDNAINNNLNSEEILALLNRPGNYGQLGPLEGVVYRGFTFAILEENDPNFVVAGNKRRYAVAYDRSGFLVLQSTPSFTLDPEVLVEELKLIIDERNLEP
jgi:hypothetical protein